jgi:hypothetical protein
MIAPSPKSSVFRSDIKIGNDCSIAKELGIKKKMTGP